jgi:hypothetical protein
MFMASCVCLNLKNRWPSSGRGGFNELTGDNMVGGDLIVEPQPSRHDEKACQQKNVYRPLQQLAPLEDENRCQFYNDCRFNLIYRKLVSARSAAPGGGRLSISRSNG